MLRGTTSEKLLGDFKETGIPESTPLIVFPTASIAGMLALNGSRALRVGAAIGFIYVISQVRQISDDVNLQLVDCSCRPGTEGTRWCNYGCACGYLTVDGHDVGDTLLAENLAHLRSVPVRAHAGTAAA